MYYLNGSGQMFVFALEDELKQVAVNQVTEDKEVFWGSPAVSNGRMVIRSGKFLYCVADKSETVDPGDTFVAKADDNAASPPSRAGGGGGNRRFDPMSMFNGMDRNKDGKVTMDELEGNRMADRLKTLDKDGDKAISKTEFTTGISTLFSRSGGGGGNYGRGKDTRPDRPQRPESAQK